MEPLPNLEVVRAVSQVVRATDAGEGMPSMEVRFSSFGTWYEIDSMWVITGTNSRAANSRARIE